MTTFHSDRMDGHWTVFERHIRQTHSHDTQRVHTFGLNRTRMRTSLCCSFIFGHIADICKCIHTKSTDIFIIEAEIVDIHEYNEKYYWLF